MSFEWGGWWLCSIHYGWRVLCFFFSLSSSSAEPSSCDVNVSLRRWIKPSDGPWRAPLSWEGVSSFPPLQTNRSHHRQHLWFNLSQEARWDRLRRVFRWHKSYQVWGFILQFSVSWQFNLLLLFRSFFELFRCLSVTLCPAQTKIVHSGLACITEASVPRAALMCMWDADLAVLPYISDKGVRSPLGIKKLRQKCNSLMTNTAEVMLDWSWVHTGFLCNLLGQTERSLQILTSEVRLGQDSGSLAWQPEQVLLTLLLNCTFLVMILSIFRF